jgi:hypothetical protein
MVWTRYTPTWAEQDISQLFFNIVPTDIDAFVPLLHELEEPLLVKVDVLGLYGCFIVFIGGETCPSCFLFNVGKKLKSLGARSGGL